MTARLASLLELWDGQCDRRGRSRGANGALPTVDIATQLEHQAAIVAAEHGLTTTVLRQRISHYRAAGHSPAAAITRAVAAP